MKNKNKKVSWSWIQSGDCLLIPDRITNFGKDGKKHPWVVINIHRGRALICPRTTTMTYNGEKKPGVPHATDRLKGFTKHGIILKNIRRTVAMHELGTYEYGGFIEMECLSALRGGKIGDKEKNHKSRPQTKNSVLKNPVLKPEIAQILKAQIEASQRSAEFSN